MATSNVFLAATTAAANSDELILAAGDVVQVSTHGLGHAECIAVEMYLGASWYPCMQGGPIVLNSQNNMLTIAGPGQYRLNKPITASAVAIYIDQ